MVTNTLTGENNFSTTISQQLLNSSDIDSACFDVPYNNSNLQNFDTSSYNIKLNENYLLTKYYKKIKASCKEKSLTKEEQIKYKYRPEALAADYYKIPGLWYLILKVNSCEDFSEFHDMEYVLLPDIGVINSCLLKEEYILKKSGI